MQERKLVEEDRRVRPAPFLSQESWRWCKSMLVSTLKVFYAVNSCRRCLRVSYWSLCCCHCAFQGCGAGFWCFLFSHFERFKIKCLRIQSILSPCERLSKPLLTLKTIHHLRFPIAFSTFGVLGIRGYRSNALATCLLLLQCLRSCCCHCC